MPLPEKATVYRPGANRPSNEGLGAVEHDSAALL